MFEVREVHVGMWWQYKSLAWTESAVAPCSDTKLGLIEVLRMMLSDVREFDVLEVE